MSAGRRPSPALRHLPVSPLLAIVATRLDTVVELDEDTGVGHLAGDDIGDDDGGVVLGVSGDTLGQWRRRGWLTARHADRVALELGLYPSLIWPEWFDDLEAEADELELEYA